MSTRGPDDTRTPPAADGDFAALGLAAALVAAVTALGYEEPTPIQREAIPPLLAGRDLLGQAATGTGKTAAFALPLLQRISPRARRGAARPPLVLVPTRELAMQVAEAIHATARHRRCASLPLYGGASMQPAAPRARAAASTSSSPRPAARSTTSGARTLKLDDVQVLVLDEADEMLDMGFAEDLEAILEATPADAADGALLGDDAAAHRRDRRAPPARTRCASTIAREKTAAGQAAPRPPGGLRRAARAEAGGARPRPRHGEPDVGDRLLPHAPRGRRAHRDAERARLPRRGAARRHGAGAARPRDEAASARARPTCSSPPTSPRAGSTSSTSRTSSTTTCPSAPEAYVHRIGRTGRAGPRGRRHHARRAARASAAAQHRAVHAAEDRDRPGADRRRPAGAPPRAHRRPRPRASRRRRPRRCARRRGVAGQEFDLVDVAAAA